MTPQVKERIEQIRRGEVPGGYKKTKVGIVPNEWTYEKLDKYLIQYHEVSEYSNQYPVLTSSRKGIFLQSDYYTREVASEDNTGYNVVPRGYFTYRHMSDDEIFKFNINTIVDKGIVSTLYPVFTTRKINDCFLQTILNEGREFRRFALLQKQGGSRTYMYFDKLKQLKICIPPIIEQEKIAEILSAQDKLIALKEKLLEEKKRQKKALMQQLLTGKKRLPGFNEEWVKSKISDISDIATGNADTQDKVDDGTYPFYVRSSYPERINTYAYDGEAILTAGDGVGVGKVIHYVIGKFNYHQRVYKISDFKESIYGKYVYYYFSEFFYNRVKKMSAKNSVDSVRLNMISDMEILVPSLEEQISIANVLSVSDQEIELLQKDLDQEKQKKKALMQLLLTGIVRV